MRYDMYQAIAQHYDSGTHVMMTGTKAACEKYVKEQYTIMQGYYKSHGIMDGEYVFFKKVSSEEGSKVANTLI